MNKTDENVGNNAYKYAFFFLLASLVIFLWAKNAYSANNNKDLGSFKSKNYYTESKKFIILKVSNDLNAYINKKNQKVHYLYKGKFYIWNRGIWFYSKTLSGRPKVVQQDKIPAPLKNGPLLRVKKKKIPVGFAASKIPQRKERAKLPSAVTEHLYNLPLTLHGLVIYEYPLNFNGIK